MNAITGYTELMNYRNLTAGVFGSPANAVPEQPADARRNTGAGDRAAAEPQTGAADQTAPRHAVPGALRETRAVLESIRRSGSSLSEDGLQDLLDDMVLRGDITDDQADELFDGLKRSREAMPVSVLKRLNVLANSGTMTAAQRDAAAERRHSSSPYMPWTRSAKRAVTAARRIFMFGVTPPSSTLNSCGRMANCFTVSQRSSLALAWSM